MHREFRTSQEIINKIAETGEAVVNKAEFLRVQKFLLHEVLTGETISEVTISRQTEELIIIRVN